MANPDSWKLCFSSASQFVLVPEYLIFVSGIERIATQFSAEAVACKLQRGYATCDARVLRQIL